MSELKTLVQQLGTRNARITFLTQLYSPGQTEVADLLLTLIEYTHKKKEISITEARAAKEAGDEKRAIEMYKFVISHETNSLEIASHLREAGYPEVTQHAIKILKSGRRGDDSVTLSEIYEMLGESQKMKESRKEALNRFSREHSYQAVSYSRRWGMNEEALRYALDNEWYVDALEIARTHFPDKAPDIAKQAFEKGRRKYDFELLGLVAQTIGNQEEVEQTIDEMVKNTLKNYEKSEIGCQLTSLLGRVCKYAVRRKPFSSDPLKEGILKEAYESQLAGAIFKNTITGMLKRLLEIRLDLVEKERYQTPQTSHYIIDFADKCYEASGDVWFLKKALPFYEQSGEYERGKRVAQLVGDEVRSQMFTQILELIPKQRTI